MKIFKRNQLIILVISLMLITAGYLNFTANTNNIETSAIAERDDSTIGDAQLVNADVVIDEKVNNIESVEADNSEKSDETSNLESKEAIETMSKEEQKNEDYYFATSKLERNSMYSELLETYQEIYNNVNSNNEQKADAIGKIANINNTKNAIMIAENLIVSKGFNDVVIFVNDNSVSVVMKEKELSGEQVAQIQNIISRELKVEADIIHISTHSQKMSE